MERGGFRIDTQLAEFLHEGLAIIVATRDDQQRPHATRGYAPQVADDGRRVTVHIARRHGDRTLANIRDNGAVAVVFSRVTDFETVQLKSRSASVGEPVSLERDYLVRYRDLFWAALASVGMEEGLRRGLWFDDLIEVSFSPDSAFRQTPGPDAGTLLEGSR